MTLSRQPAETAPSTLADTGDSAIDLSSLSPADGEDLALDRLALRRRFDAQAARFKATVPPDDVRDEQHRDVT